MKKICLFTQSLAPGGAEKQVVLLACSLKEVMNVHVLVYYGSVNNEKNLKILNEHNVQYTLLYGSSILKIFNVLKIFNKQRFDIVFNYLLLPNFLGGILKYFSKVKFSIGGIRNSFLEKKKIMLNRLLQNYINDFTIYNNYLGYETYSKLGFKKSKALVIPNCILISNGATLRDQKKKLIILSVGRFNYSKDFFTALMVIQKVHQVNKNFVYHIAGYGEEEQKIKKFIIDNSMSDYVKLFLQPENLNGLYKEADIYFQTSLFEGLSNTVMEAMSFSLPVVVTAVGDNSRLVNNNLGGYLTKPKDIDFMTSALEILLNNYEARINMGAYNYNLIKENYSQEVFKNKYLDFINCLN